MKSARKKGEDGRVIFGVGVNGDGLVGVYGEHTLGRGGHDGRETSRTTRTQRACVAAGGYGK